MKISFQRKLLVSFMIIVIVMLAGTAVGISILLRDYIMETKRQELVNKGTELVRIATDYQEGRLSATQFNSLLSSIDRFLDARVWLVDSSRKVIAISGTSRLGMGPHVGSGGMGSGGSRAPGSGLRAMIGTELEVVFSGQMWTSTFYHPFYQEEMFIVALPLPSGGGTGAVILNTPVKGLQQSLERMYFYIAAVGAIAVILALILVNWLSKGVVRPLGQMRETAMAMAEGNYDRRVVVSTNDEIGDLGHSLNILTNNLGEFVRQTERMEKLRRDFVANVSHELRTPLTIIRGYSEALLDGTISDPTELRKYYRLIRDEAERLERLNSQLLELSRLQGRAVLEMEELPLADLAQGALHLFQHNAEQKQIELCFHRGETIPLIYGNGDLLTQLLVILLDNAIKFSAPGSRVTIGVDRDGQQVVLTVADTGIGIPEADISYIWERFYKVDKSHSRNSCGTGLGLALAREIILLHNAKPEVVSQLGQGTIFYITFPAAHPK